MTLGKDGGAGRGLNPRVATPFGSDPFAGMTRIRFEGSSRCGALRHSRRSLSPLAGLPLERVDLG